MKLLKTLWTLLLGVLTAWALLSVYAYFTKPELAPEIAAPGTQDSLLTVHLTFERRSPQTTFTLLDDNRNEINSLVTDKSVVEIRKSEGATQLRIESPGHQPLTLPWPQSDHLNVNLKAEGSNSQLHAEGPDTPSTQTRRLTALRISDATTQQLLPGTEVYLDGRLVGTSSSDGELSVPTRWLEECVTLTLRKKGYEELTVYLERGKVDEMQIETLFLTPVKP